MGCGQFATRGDTQNMRLYAPNSHSLATGGDSMTAIFGVDENDWCDALKDILRRLEKKRKRGRQAARRTCNSGPYVRALAIDAWLFGEPEMINLKIARR